MSDLISNAQNTVDVRPYQPLWHELPISTVPTTNLLTFTAWLHIVASALLTVMMLFSGLACLGQSTTSNPAGVGFAFAMLGGLQLWWWIHCLSTLQTLRKFATEYFYRQFHK